MNIRYNPLIYIYITLSFGKSVDPDSADFGTNIIHFLTVTYIQTKLRLPHAMQDMLTFPLHLISPHILLEVHVGLLFVFPYYIFLSSGFPSLDSVHLVQICGVLVHLLTKIENEYNFSFNFFLCITTLIYYGV